MAGNGGRNHAMLGKPGAGAKDAFRGRLFAFDRSAAQTSDTSTRRASALLPVPVATSGFFSWIL